MVARTTFGPGTRCASFRAGFLPDRLPRPTRRCDRTARGSPAACPRSDDRDRGCRTSATGCDWQTPVCTEGTARALGSCSWRLGSSPLARNDDDLVVLRTHNSLPMKAVARTPTVLQTVLGRRSQSLNDGFGRHPQLDTGGVTVIRAESNDDAPILKTHGAASWLVQRRISPVFAVRITKPRSDFPGRLAGPDSPEHRLGKIFRVRGVVSNDSGNNCVSSGIPRRDQPRRYRPDGDQAHSGAVSWPPLGGVVHSLFRSPVSMEESSDCEHDQRREEEGLCRRDPQAARGQKGQANRRSRDRLPRRQVTRRIERPEESGANAAIRHGVQQAVATQYAAGQQRGSPRPCGQPTRRQAEGQPERKRKRQRMRGATMAPRLAVFDAETETDHVSVWQ
jgi:hypothetical protein